MVVGMAAQVSTEMSSTTTTLPGAAAAAVAVEANGTVRATSPDKRPPPPLLVNIRNVSNPFSPSPFPSPTSHTLQLLPYQFIDRSPPLNIISYKGVNHQKQLCVSPTREPWLIQPIDNYWSPEETSEHVIPQNLSGGVFLIKKKHARRTRRYNTIGKSHNRLPPQPKKGNFLSSGKSNP